MSGDKTVYQALTSTQTLMNAVSGSLASMTALAIFYPLDRVRGVAQVKDTRESALAILREIVQTEGILSLYTGIHHVLVSLGCSNFIYFYCEAFLKLVYVSKSNSIRRKIGKPLISIAEIDTVVVFILTWISAIINVLITTPLWVVATRIAVNRKQVRKDIINSNGEPNDTQTLLLNGHEKSLKPSLDKIKPEYRSEISSVKQSPKTMIGGLILLARTEGIGSLWAGISTAILLTSNPVIQFEAYRKLKRALRSYRGTLDLTSMEYLVLGGLAKMVATILTYPIQLSQTRLRSYNSSENKKTLTIFKVLNNIYIKEGIIGWFRGMDAKLTQTCLTAAFMFAFYEKLYKMFLNFFAAKKSF